MIAEFFTVLVVGLAAWRWAVFLVEEDGPWDLGQRFRDLVGASKPGQLSGFAKLFSCVWCTSFWLAVIFWVVFVELWSPATAFLSGSAAAGVALLCERVVTR